MKLFNRLPGFERAPAGLDRALVFTLALACLVVVIAKGSACVADAYPVPDADTPLTSLFALQP